MAFIIDNKDVCEICGRKCIEAYWIETLQTSGEIKEYFVCLDCYYKIKTATI